MVLYKGIKKCPAEVIYLCCRGSVLPKESFYRMKKISLALAVLMILSLAFNIFVYADDYSPEDSGILPVEQSKDIYISIDSTTLDKIAAVNENITAAQLAADLEAYLVKENPELGNGKVRIRSSSTVIDTTDLSEWYVFDHYDTGLNTSYGVAPNAGTAYSASADRPEGYFTGKRPYYAFNESRY